jgi:DNA-binding transcriptional LysR family regulator
LTLDPASGVISGTPSSTGTSTIVVTVVDAVGGSDDGRLMTRLLAPHRLVTCASPAYLQSHGVPQNIDQLDEAHAQKTLEYVQRLWGRRVHLETVVEDKPVSLSYGARGGHRSV